MQSKKLNLNIFKIFFMFLISKLETNEKFRQIVSGIAEDFYVKESLQKYRVWGDPSRVSIGKNVHLNNSIINTVSGNVVVGDNAFFGHSVSVLTGTHDYTKKGIARQVEVPKFGRDIIIGNGVWISSNVTIIGPCEIGENAVIGAGSVISGMVLSNSIYAGVPAKFVRNI